MSFCLDDGTQLLYAPRDTHSGDAATLPIHIDKTPAAKVSAPQFLQGNTRGDNVNAIAVLPFANMSRDEDAEYLSDGLAEELLNVLSRIRGLRVAGRTSSFSFKGKQTTFAEIGQQLNVSSVLEGSVRMAGKHVRISVQLVNAAGGYRLWSQTYDRTMQDIFEIQDDIANSVVEELSSRLIGNEMDPNLGTRVAVEVADATSGRAEDPESHRLMLLGRHVAERRTREDLQIAIGYFEEALRLDPSYAMCWIELGNAEFLRASHEWEDVDKSLDRALSAAQDALAVNPQLAAGHALMAKIQMTRLDFAAAEVSLSRAIELEPDNIFVLSSANQVFRQLGKFADSLNLGRRALRLDPLNGPVLQGMAQSAESLGLLQEAEVACRRSLEVSPQSSYKRALLALILAGQGRLDEARTAAESEPEEIWRLWSTAIVENAVDRERSKTVIETIIAKFGRGSSFQIAELFASCGDIDKSLEYLELAIGHDPGISMILNSSLLEPLHHDPRWQMLLAKVGIPREYWPIV